MGPEEGILYADIDIELAVRAKLTHDFAGHCNRPDVFQLHLNTVAPQILQREPAFFSQNRGRASKIIAEETDGSSPEATSSKSEEA